MRFGRRSTPPASGTSPRVTSGSESCAVVEATIRSQASASSSPPPAAQPLIAAITGLSRSNSSVRPAKPPGPYPSSSPAAAAFRSQPAEKKRSPAPVTIATLSPGSSLNPTNASPSSLLVAASIAFALGRSIVTSRIESRRSARMPSIGGP